MWRETRILTTAFLEHRFLPNIGKYMLNVLQGHSNGPEKDKAWGWKTEAELQAAAGVVKREFTDFEDGGMSSSRL